MDQFAMEWWMKQEEKKKGAMRANDVALINRMLQRVLHEITQYIEKEDYEKEARAVRRHLSQSDIWDISYRNNMEDPNVALEQALFIQSILAKADIPNKEYYENEVDIAMRRLGNIDWGMFGEYNRRKQLL